MKRFYVTACCFRLDNDVKSGSYTVLSRHETREEAEKEAERLNVVNSKEEVLKEISGKGWDISKLHYCKYKVGETKRKTLAE